MGFSWEKWVQVQGYALQTFVVPRILTELANVTVKIHCLCGIQEVVYLGNWLIWAISKEICLKAVKETTSPCKSGLSYKYELV